MYKNSNYLKMTDQNEIFIMKFNRKIEAGVYLLRLITKIKQGNSHTEIEGNSYTNFL